MFIDTHTHVTWGIDDGLQSLEDCQMALSMYKEQGVKSLIATPHFIPGTNDVKLRGMIQRMQDVQVLAKSYGIEYYPGCEFMLNDMYASMFLSKRYFTLANSQYLLVEFDVRKPLGDYDSVEERLYACFQNSLIPVIAHVERYFPVGLDLERVKEWLDMGCFLQVNRTSILGMHGKTIQKNAFTLLDQGLVHLVATDMHRVTGNRIPSFLDVYEVLMKRVGEKNAQLLTYYNPKRIIENRSFEWMVPVPKKKRFFFNKLGMYL